MQVSAFSSPGGGAPNEDHFLVWAESALVLDGITRYPDDGCVHDVPWFVRRLGAAVGRRIGSPGGGLRRVLAEAIAEIGEAHLEAGTCDLGNPVTPGSTVGLVRREGDRLDWLLLGDCTVAWRDREGRVEFRSDDRLARLDGVPAESVGGVRRWPIAYVESVRNREGGYWVAAADYRAASQALTGSLAIGEVSEVLLCTDGLTRLVERYGYSWPELFERVAEVGVEGLVELVREHGEADTRFHPEAKRHDDATGVLLRLA
ncbi:protein phosphatase 2C domain-containing protein [Glycomyces luteolus]|uniref:Protein phosphatase 2C domain-containing protein n=1 Tax=Glycomyces luteolus TaxID=2670330 RepID=A0A9X3PLD0_9ACTN|nr:protein phosphatase 2C domain-containing protein [Glycomyces luteolus]MDA1360740.1 protein phosphatase 2C domain-containing protein [Glycomyces luteolus]